MVNSSTGGCGSCDSFWLCEPALRITRLYILRANVPRSAFPVSAMLIAAARRQANASIKMASNMFTSETRETYFEPCLRLVCVDQLSCSVGVCTNFVLNAHCCCWIAYTRKHNFSNAQTIGRVLVRIFPVRRWIARICKRLAFGSKVPVKIRKHSITAGLKVQRTFPASLLASVRLLMLRLLPILDSARLQISTTEAITPPIAVQSFSR